MNSFNPEILLLGGGYTLGFLAGRLAPGSFVISSRNFETITSYKQKGWLAAQADLSCKESIRALLSNYPDIKTVIDSIPPVASSEKERDDCYRDYFELLKSTAVDRAVFLSSTGVYGTTDGSWVDERTKTSPLSDSGKKRLQVEKLYCKSGIKSCCLRLSGIYGPGRGIRKLLEQGSYTTIAGEDRWTNRIHVEDIAGVLEGVLSFKGKLPELINLSDDKPSLSSEVLRFYCENFGYALPKEISRKQAKAQGRMRLLGNQRVSNALLHKTFDYQFRYPDYSYDKNLYTGTK